MEQAIKSLLEHHPLGVFSFFILGLLLIILIQNIFFYINYKDKAYLWYSLYAFIIICDQIAIHFLVYREKVLHLEFHLMSTLHPALEWLYNSAYLIFVIEFGGLYLLRQKTAKKIKTVVYFSVFLLIVFIFLDINNVIEHLVRKAFILLQVPMLIVLIVVIYYHLFQMKTKVKYYLIFGSLAFSIFSILALSASVFFDAGGPMSWGFFYIGVFIENIFFSLGLVVKQKMVLNERNESQQELILQLRENEELKNSLTQQLQEEVKKQTSEIIQLNEKVAEDNINKLEIKFEKKMAELKVSSLQSQMNPHFIFNSLNSIKLYIIKNEKENAVYFLNKFSKLIRKILSASREKVVSLAEELDTVKLYATIENIRFKNEIDISFNIDKTLNLSTIKIPPLILQPFIENAIWHGLSSKKGEKKLHVSVAKINVDFVTICIEDNGIGRENSVKIRTKKLHQKESVGIKLTKERFASFSKGFNNNYSIQFIDVKENQDALGTKVIVELPLW